MSAVMTRADTSTLSQKVGICMILSSGAVVRPVASAPGEDMDDPAEAEAPTDSQGHSLRLIEAAGQASTTPARKNRFAEAMPDEPLPIVRFVGDSTEGLVRAGRVSEADPRDHIELYASPVFETPSQATMRPTVPPDRPQMIESPAPKAREVVTKSLSQ